MAMSAQLAKALVKGIQEQMDVCPYHDVIVIVDGTEFKCHRFLLSACSDFFRKMFQSGMKEDLDKKVVVKNISSTVFELVIDSTYYAKRILTYDNVSSVWHAANQLQIGYLLEECENFQVNRLSKDNCVPIHIDAKLLSSKKLLDLTWAIIIKEFDYLRKGDDILFLDFEDMKCLVGDDNLTVPSEDVVIETIMRWMRFNPEQYLMESIKIKGGEENGESDQQESADETKKISVGKGKKGSKDSKSKDQSKNKQENTDEVQRDKHASTGKQTLEILNPKEKKEDVVFDRQGFLSELLTASKLLLVSGACLQNLLENEMVLEDPKAFRLVREGLRYNLQPGSRNSYCPLYGKYRNTSLFQNVIFTISFLDPMNYSFRTLDGKWYLQSSGAAMKCRAVTYGNDIYWTAATGTHQLAIKYDSSINTWTTIASLNVPRQDHALVCLDNFIYAIGGINCISIERFDVEAEQKVPGSGRWENFGDLVQPMTNLMATTSNSMIVIFGSESVENPSMVVQTFNTQSISANIYTNNMSGSASNMVSFKHGEDTFVLQKNGALWKVYLKNNSLLKIKFHTMLWGDPFQLSGAVVTNQELLVFGENIDPQMPREWDVYKFEHFKKIKVIERQGYCFLNTVIPKKFLLTRESECIDNDISKIETDIFS